MKTWLKRLESLDVIIFFIASAIIFSWVLIKNNNVMDDGAFYSKISELLAHTGFVKSLPWLSATDLNQNFPGLHFLFTYLLVPFTFIFGKFVGINIAAGMFFAFTLSVFSFILKKLEIKYPIFWTLLLMFSSADFMYRMILPRPISLSLACLLLAVYSLFKKKYLSLFIISFLYTWLYDGYMLLAGLIILYGIIEYFSTKKIENKNLIGLLGILAGLIINPYFPENIRFFHSSFNPILYGGVQKINEWLPSSWRYSLQVDLLPIVFWIIAAANFLIDYKKAIQNPKRLFLFLLSFTFLVLTIAFRRFIEYWPAFVILFFIFEYENFFSTLGLMTFKKGWARLFVGSSLIILIAWVGIYNAFQLKNELSQTENISLYEKPIKVISDQSNEGDIVFNTNWGDFVKFFYWDDKNYYVGGLDPILMYKKDPKLFWLYTHIANNEKMTCDVALCTPQNSKDIIEVMKNVFGAKYLILRNDDNKNLQNILHNYHILYSNFLLTSYAIGK